MCAHTKVQHSAKSVQTSAVVCTDFAEVLRIGSVLIVFLYAKEDYLLVISSVCFAYHRKKKARQIFLDTNAYLPKSR